MEKQDPLEAIGETIGAVATFCLFAPIAAIAVATTASVYNVMNPSS